MPMRRQRSGWLGRTGFDGDRFSRIARSHRPAKSALLSGRRSEPGGRLGIDPVRGVLPIGCHTGCYTSPMPSPHRRVALVADDPIREALETVRRANSGAAWAEARVVREAVFDGAFFEALRDAVAATGPGTEDLSAVFKSLHELLPDLDLSPEIKQVISTRMEETLALVDSDHRRKRQLALLTTPDPYGATALAVSDELDELSHLPR